VWHLIFLSPHLLQFHRLDFDYFLQFLQAESRLHLEFETWTICEDRTEPLLFTPTKEDERLKSRDSVGAGGINDCQRYSLLSRRRV
jgi:hypothetical protein